MNDKITCISHKKEEIYGTRTLTRATTYTGYTGHAQSSYLANGSFSKYVFETAIFLNKVSCLLL